MATCWEATQQVTAGPVALHGLSPFPRTHGCGCRWLFSTPGRGEAAANSPGAGGAQPHSEVAHVVRGPKGQGVCFQGK